MINEHGLKGAGALTEKVGKYQRLLKRIERFQKKAFDWRFDKHFEIYKGQLKGSIIPIKEIESQLKRPANERRHLELVEDLLRNMWQVGLFTSGVDGEIMQNSWVSKAIDTNNSKELLRVTFKFAKKYGLYKK